ncbi:MAG TPA: hypothetical protein VJZ00_00500 [Thermoanaerobaculia bacterium]|nr:hypothetical protein [Thermoanaerobaculia bacterium]
MKASTTILMLLLAFAALGAQADERPDYSTQGLLRLFSGETPRPTGERALQFSYGVIDYRTFGGTHVRFSPAVLPLSGSEFRTTQVMPDPFALTHTQIATSRRAWRTQRSLNSELRRIEKTERAKLRVKTE